MKECPHCHKPVEDGAPICNHCGAILPPAGPAAFAPPETAASGRPASITLALKLIVASWVIYLLTVPFNPYLAEEPLGQIAIYLFIDTLIVFVLLWKIYERQNWARIAYLVLCIASTVATLAELESTFQANLFYGISEAGTLVVDLYAAYLLYRKGSQSWFAKKPGSGNKAA
jgi:hypothetical protein